MASCPACGTKVDSDFGMKTCPSCSLVFMVDIEGHAAMPETHEPDAGQYVSSDDSSNSVESEAPAYESPNFDVSAETVVDSGMAPTYVGTDSPPEDDFGLSDSAGTEVRSEVYGDHDSASEAHHSGDYSSAEPTEIYSSSTSEDGEYNEGFINDSFEEDAALPEDDPKDPIGVQRFDAHQASQLTDGPYYYDLTISGLDTAQIKDDVLKALTDKRFQWTPDDVRRRLRNGKLLFKNLNPVKAVLVVIKLQHIDVDVQWVQKLHTDPSVAGGTPGQV